MSNRSKMLCEEDEPVGGCAGELTGSPSDHSDSRLKGNDLAMN